MLRILRFAVEGMQKLHNPCLAFLGHITITLEGQFYQFIGIIFHKSMFLQYDNSIAVFREDVKMGPCARDIVENFSVIFGRLWSRRGPAPCAHEDEFFPKSLRLTAYVEKTGAGLENALDKTKCFARFFAMKIVLALGLGP